MKFYDGEKGNNDGAITLDEMPEALKRLFAHADTEKDDKLSKKEIAAVVLRYVKARNELRYRGHDKNGDWEITTDEVEEGDMDFFNEADMDWNGTVDLIDLMLYYK